MRFLNPFHILKTQNLIPFTYTYGLKDTPFVRSIPVCSIEAVDYREYYYRYPPGVDNNLNPPFSSFWSQAGDFQLNVLLSLNHSTWLHEDNKRMCVRWNLEIVTINTTSHNARWHAVTASTCKDATCLLLSLISDVLSCMIGIKKISIIIQSCITVCQWDNNIIGCLNIIYPIYLLQLLKFSSCSFPHLNVAVFFL